MKDKMPSTKVPGCQQELAGPEGVALARARRGQPKSALRLLRRLGPLALVVGLVVLVLAMGWHHKMTLENVVVLRDRFREVLAEHPIASVLAYVVLYITAASLSLPGCPIMTATGGLLFGWFIGGLATVVGATIGATILFLIARSALGGALSERAAPWLAKLREGFKQDALSYLLFLRLVPAFPFWFVNIAPAVLDVPLRTYVIGTFLGIIPASFAFASAGAGLDSIIVAAKAEYMQCAAEHGAEACKLTVRATSLVTSELVLALVLLGVVALIPVALRRWRTNHAAAK